MTPKRVFNDVRYSVIEPFVECMFIGGNGAEMIKFRESMTEKRSIFLARAFGTRVSYIIDSYAPPICIKRLSGHENA